jgi:hypothetical protein
MSERLAYQAEQQGGVIVDSDADWQAYHRQSRADSIDI